MDAHDIKSKKGVREQAIFFNQKWQIATFLNGINWVDIMIKLEYKSINYGENFLSLFFIELRLEIVNGKVVWIASVGCRQKLGVKIPKIMEEMKVVDAIFTMTKVYYFFRCFAAKWTCDWVRRRLQQREAEYGGQNKNESERASKQTERRKTTTESRFNILLVVACFAKITNFPHFIHRSSAPSTTWHWAHKKKNQDDEATNRCNSVCYIDAGNCKIRFKKYCTWQ